MIGYIVYEAKDAQENESYIHWFQDEAKRKNISLKLLLKENITFQLSSHHFQLFDQDKKLPLPSFLVNRTTDDRLSEQFEMLGVRVFNRSYISRICNNKILTYTEICRREIPMLKTMVLHGMKIKEPPLQFPFVLKNPYGRGGREVFWIESFKDWENAKRDLPVQKLIAQKANVQLGKDLRVFVIGEEIIGAVLRSNPKDFRANFKLGGTAEWYDLSDKEIKLVHKIIKAYPFDLVGIDFLIGKDGELYFNEIEDVVGSRTLSATSDINLLEKYIKHIIKELK